MRRFVAFDGQADVVAVESTCRAVTPRSSAAIIYATLCCCNHIREALLLQLYPCHSRTTPAYSLFAVTGQPDAWTRCAQDILGGGWGAG